MIGGVVGTEVVRYDIWGKDVIIANNMESEGEKGHINVSETTKNWLERSVSGYCRYQFHKSVRIEKIHTQIDCYLVFKDDEQEPDDPLQLS